MRFRGSYLAPKPRRAGECRRLTTFDRGLHGLALGLVPDTYQSLLNFERLEDRSLLSASPLVVDLSPDTQTDSISIALDASGTNLQVAVNGNVARSVPLASVSEMSIVGSPYGNALSVDSTNGAPIPAGGLVFKGAAAGLIAGESNFLILHGGSFTAESYTPISQNSGHITFFSASTVSAISFENVATVQDTMSASVLSVSATSGNDAISYQAGGQRPNLNLGTVEVNNFTPVLFANKVKLHIDGTAGTDSIEGNTAAAATGLSQIEVTGSSTSTVVINGGANQNINFAPTDAHTATINGAGAVPISVSGVSRVTIDGDQSADNLTISTPVGPSNINAITVTPGDTAASASISIREFNGPALLPISYTNFAHTGSLNFLHTGGGRTDELYLSGSGVNDTFEAGTNGTDDVEIHTQSGGSRVGATLAIHTAGISDVTLEGSAGQAIFDVGAPLPYHSLTLIGSGSTDPAVANLTGNGTAVTVSLGGTTQTATGGGLATVNLSGVAVVNLNANGGAVTAVAVGVGNNNLDVKPIATNAATLQDNGTGPTLNLSGAASLIVSLPAAAGTDLRNVLTFDAPAANADVMIAVEGQVSVLASSSSDTSTNELPVSYNPADLTELWINGHGGFRNSLFVDSSAGAVTTPILYDGGTTSGRRDLNIEDTTNVATSDTYTPGTNPGDGKIVLVFPSAAGPFEQVTFRNLTPRSVFDHVAGPLSVSAINVSTDISYQGIGDGVAMVEIPNHESLRFENKTSVRLDVASANNTVDLDTTNPETGLTQISVRSTSVSETTVVINGGANLNINVAPTDAHTATINGAGAVPINVSGVDQVTIDGDQSADNLTITTPVGSFNGNAITVRPGDTAASASVSIREFGGAALLPISYINFAYTGSLNFLHTGGGRTDELYLSGSGVNDTFQVGLDGMDQVAFGTLTDGSLTGAALRIHAGGISAVTLDGSAGQARFDVGTAQAWQSLTLIGDGSTDSATVNLFGDGTAMTANLGAAPFSAAVATLTGGGLGSVITNGVGVVNLKANGGAVTIAGAGNDSLAVTPTGTAAATVQDNSADPLVNVAGVNASGLIVSLPATGNTLTVNGSAGNDAIKATNSEVAVNNFLPINYTAANLAALDVNGRDGTDSLVVDGTNGAVTTPTYYDGGNALNNNIVLQGGTASFDEYEPTIDAGQRALTIVYPYGTEQVFSKNIAYVQDNVTSGSLSVQGYASASTIKYRSAGDPLIQVDNAPGIFFENKSSIDILAYGNATVDLDSSSTPAGLNHIYVQGTATNGAFNVAVNVLSPPGSNVTYAPTSSNNADITGSGPVPMTVTSVAGVNVDGGGGNTNLTITTPVGSFNGNAITVTPGDTAASASVAIREFGGAALLPISYSNFARSGSLNFLHTNGGRTDALYLSGSGVNDTFLAGTNGTDEIELDAVNGGSLVGATLGMHTMGISDVTLDGSSGLASFNVAAPLPYHSLTLIGNGSTDPAVANLTAGGTAIAVSLGGATPIATGGSLGTVILFGVDDVNLAAGAGDITLAGASATDDLTVIPSGANTATASVGSSGPLVNTGNTGKLIVDAATKVVVQGTQKANQFTIDETARTVTLAIDSVNLKPLTLKSDVADVKIVGGPTDDTFLVIPARSTTGNDVVGSATFQLPGNLLVQVEGGGGANDALLVAGTGGATLVGGSYGTAGLFAVIDRASSTQGTVRLFQQSGGAEPIQYPDISYSDVQRVQANTPGAGGFAARTLVLGPDPYDPNDSPATAAYLGSAGTINAANLAIFPNAYENGSPKALGAEHDWFRVVAQSTGTLDFQVYFQQWAGFLPGEGELLVDVYDASGNPIVDFGSNVDTSNQRRRIPAVAGETYYLHVHGALNTSINGYSLSVINTPVPKPDSVELLNAVAPNVTNTSTPTITIRLDAANTPGDGLADLPAGGSSSGQPPDGQSILIPFWSGAATAPNAPSNNGSFRIAVYDETSPQSSTPLGYASAVSPGVFKFQPSAPLAEGQHTLVAKVEFDSPSTITAKDVGPGVSLPVLIESHAPAVSFGSAGVPNSGLDAASDTGVPGQPATLGDLITSASAPTFFGTAAAGAIVKLYAHLDGNGVSGKRDVLIGQTVALSSADTNPSATVPWKITSNVDLNNASLGFPLDGVRSILVTATDAAGNVSAPQSLTIFLDTQGPRVSNVSVTASPAFRLFADKTTTPSPTPLVGSLDVTFNDLPSHVGPAFVYPAVNGKLATTLGNYQLVGESTGNVTIGSVSFADSSTPGAAGASVATLHFAKPLADDRYTLIVSDHITDNAGNALDGEFGGVFPSGDGGPGGSFVASFTVNSHPHLGMVSAGSESIDLNGNLVFDPQNPDAKNRDTAFTFGFSTDQVFAGKLADSHGVVNGFDKLIVYGFAGGHSRWLFDLNGDGNFDPSTGDLSVAEPLSITTPAANFDGHSDGSAATPLSTTVTPLAANFDGHPTDGAQVGLFDGTTWWLDVLNHHTIDQADVQAGGKLSGNMRGQPIVGDFDGDGKVDLATYNNGTLFFDLSGKDRGGKLTGNWNTTFAIAPLVPNTANLQSNQIKVVAADMDQDGIADIGFYVMGGGETQSTAAWYWLISNDPTRTNRVTGTANTLNHPFDPAPLGTDLFADFGSVDAQPIVGLFDPPPDGGGSATASSVLSGTATWVNKEYIDVLGRQPGAGELNYWVGQVDGGASPAAVAQAIMDSDEHLASVIGQLYQQYLGRAADTAGTQYWSTVWKQNGGPEQVQAGIIGSPEYFKTAQSLYPNLSADEAWVTALYQNILSRDVDPQGLAYWVKYIETHPKESVVLGFVTSDEYRLTMINDWFDGYLGRPVDSAGAAYWLHQLQAYAGQDAVEIDILSSDEYTQD